MRTMLLRCLLVATLAAIVSCSGSASETPWPAEPEGPALGPAGESDPMGTIDVKESPDAAAPENVEP